MKGVSGKSDFFCIVLPIGIAYWPLFIPLGIIRAYSFRLESLGPLYCVQRVCASEKVEASGCLGFRESASGQLATEEVSDRFSPGPKRPGRLGSYGPSDSKRNEWALVIPCGMNRGQ